MDTVLETTTVTAGEPIEAGQNRSFRVEIDVPLRTPITDGRTPVWLDTGLDVDWAVDPDDRDRVEVRPDPLRKALFDAAESLGFSLGEAECEAAGGLLSSRQFVQEFEFVPHSGPFAGALDELELVPVAEGDGFDVLVEVDRKGGPLSEHFDADESTDRFTIGPGDESAVEDRLRSIVERYA